MGLEAKNAAWDVERELAREEKPGAPARAGGARAEFLANLGRRVAELSSMLVALEREPGSSRLRDDLRRRLHALGVGARLLRFDRLAAEVTAAEDLLGEVAERGALAGPDTTALRAALGKLPTLGFTANDIAAPESDGRASQANHADPGPAAAARPWPLSILVVGPKPIADALVQPAADGAPAIDVERTEDGLRAIDLARAVAPDVVVVDVDQRGARELVIALRADPLTAGAAVVALGTWSRAEEASAFLVAGATRAVHKPVSPDALRRVCRDAGAASPAGEPSSSIGLVSLPELAERLGREVERAITDGAKTTGDAARVDLGRGDEVLGAVLAAAARVRDVVTIQSRGEIRFTPGAAERAVPVGAWMNEPAPAPEATRVARRGGARSGAIAAKALAGARVLVVDDDPAVAWFLAGVLRAEGATVSEACDGAVALRKAMEQGPDVVLSDVLMPNVDGLTLTEALRADLLLADAAVVLLSWKDDLLQRARELGARADAYLRKDASGPAVVERVRELLYPRARLAERVAAGGEVHGRVDGLTMCTLLRLVCTHRPACVIEVRDAAYLYEVEVDGGRPVSATRTAKDGTFVTGAQALARLIGVRAGRFVVAPRRETGTPGASALLGTLQEQIRPHAAAARGAVHLLEGPGLASVTRIVLDDDWLGGYGALAPEPQRALVRKLVAGDAPRKLITSGLGVARLFEEVVLDAAARGAVTKILGPQGEDMLPAAVAAELAVLRGDKLSVAPPPPEAAAEESIPVDEVSPSGVVVAPAGIAGDAVAPAPGLLASATTDLLVARGAQTSGPPAVTAAPAASAESIEIDASAAPAAAAPGAPLLTLGSLTPPPAAPRIEPEAPKAAPVIKMARRAAPVVAEEEDDSPPPQRAKKKAKEARAESTPAAPAVKPGGQRMSVWVLCAVAGIVFAVGARISQDRRTAAPPAPPAPVATAEPTAAAAPLTASPAPSSAPAPTSAARVTVPGETAEDPLLPQEAPLRADEKIPSGQGLLEVIVGPNDEVSIDGQPTVAGPVVKATLAPRDQPYEVKVKLKGEERTRYALIKQGKRTRVRIAPPWNR